MIRISLVERKRISRRVTRARFESYYRRIKRARVLKTSQEEKKREKRKGKNWNCKKVMLAPRCLWMAIFFFFFLPFTGREAFAKCDYFTRERSTFPPLIFALWTVKGRNAFLERYKRAVRLVRSFIHSFFLRSFRFNALCPMNLFFLSFFLYLHPLGVLIKGRHFLGKVAINEDRWMKGIKKVSFA